MSTTIPTPEDLATLRLPELRRRYEEVYGETTKVPNKTWLVRKIIAGLEAKAADEAHAAKVAQQAEPAAPPTLDATEVATVAAQAEADGTVSSPEEAADLAATLTKQGEQEAATATAAEPEPEPTGPWGDARTTEERLPIARRATTIAEIDSLLTEDLQARVRTELEAQRKALAPIEALTDDDDSAIGTLKALLGNRRTHKRPGVLAAVQRRLAELDPDGDATPIKPLADMDLGELRAAYEAEVGRTTGSDHRGYLIWKVREARKGRITIGAVGGDKAEGEMKTVPVRLGEDLLTAIDEAWKREGFSSRVAFIREVLGERVAAK